MRALVIGYGSIGARHVRLLSELGCSTAVVSARNIDFPIVYDNMAAALSAHCPDYVVVANSTHQHHDALLSLAECGFNGRVLVEKPLFDHVRSIPRSSFHRLMVAYNLRWHPALQRLRAAIGGQFVLSVQAYVGQYLPDWRPQSDYRQSYSASVERGGGVLRDLSHELDYLCWILGSWKSVAAIGGHFSPLVIDSDDLYAVLLQCERCPAITLQLSYLDRAAQRRVLVNTSNHTYELDFIRGTFACDGILEQVPVERDHTYREMHRAVLNSDFSNFCSEDEGLQIMDLIAAIERANERKEWVSR